MDAELKSSYRAAETVARRRARNFFYAFLVLPAEKRRALSAVYAFMRACDDISDGTAHVAEKRSLLERQRSQLDAAPKPETDADPTLPAFRDTMRRFSIPAQYFHWIIDGAEMDLETSRYRSFEDLRRYCFHVASAVGLVCIQIFGFSDESAREYAEECGIAFQLTNILRDVGEDARMGRIYLPEEDMERFGCTPQAILDGGADGAFRELMAFEAGRAIQYYERARSLIPLVESDSRAALWAMMEIYRRLLDKIVRSRYGVLHRRIRLSGLEKSAIAARALASHLLG